MAMASLVIQSLLAGALMSALILVYWPMVGVPDTPAMITFQVFVINFIAFIFSWLIKSLIKRER